MLGPRVRDPRGRRLIEEVEQAVDVLVGHRLLRPGVELAGPPRRRGVGRQLNAAVVAWARDCGCREYASDALLDNRASHAFHAALGFAETERVVYFRRVLE